MRIRHLQDPLINQIAAGEVIERPAAAVKELVENAIDAGAETISVTLEKGGKSLMIVEDDGHGMSREELAVCLDRHATSKLADDDLLHIQHLGFRGEALPSIASVSRLNIASHNPEDQTSWELEVNGGKKSDARPCARPKGTRVTVRDLFYSTPARLKFLKSEQAESRAVKEILQRLALTAPHIAFDLKTDGKTVLSAPAGSLGERIKKIMGRDFMENAMPVEAAKEDVRLYGFASLPTYHRGNSLNQFLFVNGRAVKDRLLLGALKGAYSDVLARDRFPLAALYLTLPPEEVDVNVHPAKAEVRFRNAAGIRGLLVSAVRQAIHMQGGRSADNTAALGSFARSGSNRDNIRPLSSAPPRPSGAGHGLSGRGFAELAAGFYRPLMDIEPSARAEETLPPETDVAPVYEPGYLGAARTQIHENYIIAQTETGMVIVDQHAAHERLVYERLKTQKAETGIEKQGLLVPEIVELGEDYAENLLKISGDLAAFGLDIEPFGPGAVAIQTVPALLGSRIDLKSLIKDLSDELEDQGSTNLLQEKIYEILSRRACHGSIRSGRRMNIEEMNRLLRDMENSPLSGQCNHGRPTYVSLDLNAVEKMFGRR